MRLPLRFPPVAALAALVILAMLHPGCICAPSQECQLVRALCKIDVCIKTDAEGWYACQRLPDQCDPIEGACTTRGECVEGFMSRCTERMVPGASSYMAYRQCAELDCSTPRPPASPPPDAVATPDARPPTVPDAAPPGSSGPPPCAGVMCNGACCTAYPCFSGKGCTCAPSVSACMTPDAGASTPPLTPACCSDAPLCSAQNKQCCFVPATADTPAQTRCLTKCPESRHCTFAPYLQLDGTTSCLPAPYDTAGVLCPF